MYMTIVVPSLKMVLLSVHAAAAWGTVQNEYTLSGMHELLHEIDCGLIGLHKHSHPCRHWCPHFTHLKNRVAGSSADLIWTSLKYAW